MDGKVNKQKRRNSDRSRIRGRKRSLLPHLASSFPAHLLLAGQHYLIPVSHCQMIYAPQPSDSYCAEPAKIAVETPFLVLMISPCNICKKRAIDICVHCTLDSASLLEITNQPSRGTTSSIETA